jgi:glycosyltransferase involved in cell wall biosynthesis
MKANSSGKRIWAHIAEFFNYGINDKFYDRIVISTNEDKVTNWKGNDNVVVIPNPSSIQPSRGSLLETKRVLAIGRLVYEKNFASLIRAFAFVVDRFPDWKLDILGEGYERQSLEEQIVRLSLEDNVFLRGTQTDLPNWLSHSSIFVMTSHYEGLPLVLLEAINYGLPVVSYDYSCGPKDVITDGQNGFIVPKYDEKELASRICQLIEDEELRKRMGAAAFERAKDFSTEKIIKEWMSLFHELTSEKSGV